MRAHLHLAALILLTALAAAQQTPNARKLGSVSGTVLTTTGDPVKRAQVTLSPSEEADDEERAAVTDDAGRFTIGKVAAGQYVVSVQKAGYTAPRLFRRGKTVTVAAGQDVRELTIRVAAAVAIHGHVVDETGEPLENATITASIRTVLPGIRGMQPIGNAQTDDRGEYRVFGLSPGRYYVVAFYSDSSRKSVYAPSYYPAAASLESAQPVQLASGDDITANFTLTAAGSFAVRGHVTGAGEGEQLDVIALPAFDEGLVTRGLVPGSGGQVRKDGSFELKQLLPGKYVIQASAYAEEDERGVRMARQIVTVGAADVEGIQLNLQRAQPQQVEIKGELKVEGAVPKSGPGALFVMTQAAETNEEDPSAPMSVGGAVIAKDGSFTLGTVRGPRMYATVNARGRGWEDYYLKAVRLAGQDVTRSGFRPTGGAGKLEIVVAADGARVDGKVVDAHDKPVPDIVVIGIPERGLRDQLSFYQHATTDQNGQFVMRGVAPGEYTVVAADDLDEASLFDPEVMSKYDGKGQTLRTETNGHHTVVLHFGGETQQ